MDRFPTLEEIEAIEQAWRAQRVRERSSRRDAEEDGFVTFAALDGTILDEQDFYNLSKYRKFRLAAQAIAAEMAKLAVVSRVVLFGSVAQPLVKEVHWLRKYRRAGREVWHECKDVDLAVWVDNLDTLTPLQRARSLGVNTLGAPTVGGVAHHQVDVFLFISGSNEYRGRLCTFGTCPKSFKENCQVPDCGKIKLLRQHAQFRFQEEALAEGKIIELYRRKDLDL